MTLPLYPYTLALALYSSSRRVCSSALISTPSYYHIAYSPAIARDLRARHCGGRDSVAPSPSVCAQLSAGPSRLSLALLALHPHHPAL